MLHPVGRMSFADLLREARSEARDAERNAKTPEEIESMAASVVLRWEGGGAPASASASASAFASASRRPPYFAAPLCRPPPSHPPPQLDPALTAAERVERHARAGQPVQVAWAAGALPEAAAEGGVVAASRAAAALTAAVRAGRLTPEDRSAAADGVAAVLGARPAAGGGRRGGRPPLRAPPPPPPGLAPPLVAFPAASVPPFGASPPPPAPLVPPGDRGALARDALLPLARSLALDAPSSLPPPAFDEAADALLGGLEAACAALPPDVIRAPGPDGPLAVAMEATGLGRDVRSRAAGALLLSAAVWGLPAGGEGGGGVPELDDGSGAGAAPCSAAGAGGGLLGGRRRRAAGPPALARAVALCGDTEPAVRRGAARALPGLLARAGRLGGDGGGAAAVLARELAALLDDEEPAVRTVAMASLATALADAAGADAAASTSTSSSSPSASAAADLGAVLLPAAAAACRRLAAEENEARRAPGLPRPPWAGAELRGAANLLGALGRGLAPALAAGRAAASAAAADAVSALLALAARLGEPARTGAAVRVAGATGLGGLACAASGGGDVDARAAVVALVSSLLRDPHAPVRTAVLAALPEAAEALGAAGGERSGAPGLWRAVMDGALARPDASDADAGVLAAAARSAPRVLAATGEEGRGARRAELLGALERLMSLSAAAPASAPPAVPKPTTDGDAAAAPRAPPVSSWRVHLAVARCVRDLADGGGLKGGGDKGGASDAGRAAALALRVAVAAGAADGACSAAAEAVAACVCSLDAPAAARADAWTSAVAALALSPQSGLRVAASDLLSAALCRASARFGREAVAPPLLALLADRRPGPRLAALAVAPSLHRCLRLPEDAADLDRLAAAAAASERAGSGGPADAAATVSARAFAIWLRQCPPRVGRASVASPSAYDRWDVAREAAEDAAAGTWGAQPLAPAAAARLAADLAGWTRRGAGAAPVPGSGLPSARARAKDTLRGGVSSRRVSVPGSVAAAAAADAVGGMSLSGPRNRTSETGAAGGRGGGRALPTRASSRDGATAKGGLSSSSASAAGRGGETVRKPVGAKGPMGAVKGPTPRARK